MKLSKIFAAGVFAFAAGAASASVPVLFENGDNFGINPVNAQFLANGQGVSNFDFTLVDNAPAGFFSVFDLLIEDMGSIFKNPVTVQAVSVTGGSFSQSITPVAGAKSVTFSGLSAGAYTLSFNNTVSGFGGLVGKATAVANVSPVPEAETYALALAGLGVVGLVAARRRKQ